MVTLKTIKTKFILSSKDGHFFSLVPLQKTWQHFRKWKVQFIYLFIYFATFFLTHWLPWTEKEEKEKKKGRGRCICEHPPRRAVLK